MNASYRSLSPQECKILANSLGDKPETVIHTHLLYRNLAHAYIEGTPENFSCAIIQSLLDPEEPIAFGDDPELIWQILQSVPEWQCISVIPECAGSLSKIMIQKMGQSIRPYGDVYHALYNPAQTFHHIAVRQLTKDDRRLLENCPEELSTFGYENLGIALKEGIIVGGIVEGELVSVAHTSARTNRHSDIGIHTLEAWRNQGIATAAASLTAQLVQACNQIPVWSNGEDNYASLRIAQKIGFAEVQRRIYLISRRS